MHLPNNRPILAVWFAGAAALVGMLAFSWLTVAPYPTAWPWITFMAIAIVEEALVGPVERDPCPGPRIVLIAAVIMFRKHPDVIALVTLAAGLAGGFLARSSWRAVLTRTGQLLILAAAGTAALRTVGYADTIHFVAATAVLVLVYLAGIALVTGVRLRPVRWIGAGVVGALLALAWRTPSSGPLMLRLGEVLILGLIGIVVGFVLGGNPRSLLKLRLRFRKLPVLAIGGAAILLLSSRLQGQLGATAAVAGLALIGVFAVTRRWFPVACTLLGGMLNEIARIANSGRMPVATAELPARFGDDLRNLDQTSATYRAVDAQTHLAWLADRFPLPAFPGVASVGDIVIALGIVWVFASLTAATGATDRLQTGSNRAAA